LKFFSRYAEDFSFCKFLSTHYAAPLTCFFVLHGTAFATSRADNVEFD